MELFYTDIDYSTLILRVFPLDQIAHVGVSPSRLADKDQQGVCTVVEKPHNAFLKFDTC